MIGIVIVAHGGLANEFLASLEHVVGVQEGITAIAIDSDANREQQERQICSIADKVDTGSGVVVVADLYGSSASNLAKTACLNANRKFMFGANMPLLIKLAKSRRKPLDEAVKSALDAGHSYMNATQF